MSRLEELFEQLKAKSTEVFEKVKETESFQQLSDRYQGLTPGGQKSVKILGFTFVVFIFLFFPLSQISTSKDFISSFQDKRNLIRDLFKTYRESNQSSRLMPAPSSSSLIGSINSTLQGEQILPEQIVSVGMGAAEGRMIPQNLMTDVIDIKLVKLNLRQVVDIGARLSAISQSVKLKDLMMSANAEISGYFDVTYKMYSLNIPAPPIELPPEPEVKSKKNKNTDTEGSENSGGNE